MKVLTLSNKKGLEMKKVIVALSILLILSTTLYAKKYALVVGVPSGFAPNSGIELDMALMEDLLKQYGYTIRSLTDPRPKDLKKLLKLYSNHLTPNDNFVFYYTGHGAQVPDKNRDEPDGKDEVLCLKEKIKGELGKGNWSSLFVDDELYVLLSKINSKKFVFFDSCNSGTAFKSGSDSIAKTKGYFPDYVTSKSVEVQIIPKGQDESTASLMFFGAAKDGTSAQATKQGSMFTLSIVDALKRKKGDLNSDGKITFKELEIFTVKNIKKLCGTNTSLIFIPEMHTESFGRDEDIIKTLTSTGGSLRVTSSRSDLENGLDRLLSDGLAEPLKVSAKSSYNNGDSIKLKIDSKNYKGYLYVIYTDTKEYTVLYPNKYAPESKKVAGTMAFPNRSFGNFRLSAGKPYGRTAIFTILSDEPLNLYDKGMSGVFNVFDRESPKSMTLMRGVSVKSNRMFIGKTVFDVKP